MRHADLCAPPPRGSSHPPAPKASPWNRAPPRVAHDPRARASRGCAPDTPRAPPETACDVLSQDEAYAGRYRTQSKYDARNSQTNRRITLDGGEGEPANED